MSNLIEQIEKLQLEIKAMQADPLLKDQYGKKVRELIRLRRSQIRLGKKKAKNEEMQ